MLALALATEDAAAFSGASFSPAALFTGGALGGYYDPTDTATLFQDTAGTTPITASGQTIARVNDKSGNGNHLIQATASLRPLYNVSGSVKSILFDGVDDAFNITNSATLLTGWTAGSGAFAAKIAADPPPATVFGVFGFFSNAGGDDFYADTSGSLGTGFLTSVRKAIATPADRSLWRSNGVRSAPNSYRYEIDGVEKLNTATNTFAATTGNASFPTIGEGGFGANYFKGNLGRLLFINRTLSDTEVAKARTWIAAGYGVAL